MDKLEFFAKINAWSVDKFALFYKRDNFFLLIKPKVKPIFQKITVEHIEKKTSKYRQVYICVNVVFQIKMINVSIIVGPISVPWGGYPEQMLTKISNSVEQWVFNRPTVLMVTCLRYSDSLEGEITHIGMPLKIVPLKNEIKKN